MVLKLAAVILAGGGAVRMGGGDKALLPFGSETLLDALLRRLRPQAGTIAISANGDPARFARFGLPILPDEHPGMGPLAGIAAALAWAAAAGATDLLVVPADTPFIPADLAERLHPAPSMAAAGGRSHNLVCRLPVMCGPLLAARLRQSHTRAGDFLRLINARPVAFDDPAAFLNINTPDDLEQARARFPGPACL